jgi:hypothetical protein
MDYIDDLKKDMEKAALKERALRSTSRKNDEKPTRDEKMRILQGRIAFIGRLRWLADITSSTQNFPRESNLLRLYEVTVSFEIFEKPSARSSSP